MYAKILSAIVIAAGIAVALVGFREQRLFLSHDMASCHERINLKRQQLWDLQSQLAEQVTPVTLTESIGVTSLEMEPVTPSAQGTRPVPLLVVGNSQHDR